MLSASRSSSLLRNSLLLQRKATVPHYNCNNATHRLPKTARHFHASHPKHSAILDACLNQTHTLIAGLHASTGLPWFATLPLTAFLVRVCLITPLKIYNHQQVKRQLALRPLLFAWARPLRLRINEQHAALGEAYVQEEFTHELKIKGRQLQKKLGVSNLGLLAPLIQLPIWLVIMETIRKMCGTHHGLLGLVAKSFSQLDSEGWTDTSSVVVDYAAASEPSMAIEGALWFPNLLDTDPKLLLPFMLSASIFGLIRHTDLSVIRRNGRKTKWQKRLSRIFKLLALAIGPLTLHMPSAMLVYWLSSSLMALCQSYLFERSLPYPPPTLPCKPNKTLF